MSDLDVLSNDEAQSLVNGELAQALQRIYLHEIRQSAYTRSLSLDIARDALISVGLCPHSWQSKEARARLDSRSYALQGMLFIWECEWCGARQRSATMPDHWHGLSESSVIDVEPKESQ